MKLSKEQIKEAADYLESGFIVFYSLKNKELIIVTQSKMEEAESLITSDEELDEEYMKELDNEFDFSTIKDIYENSDDYYEFENMDSRDSFRLMEEFAESVSDKNLRDNLFFALERPKPFRNFKYELEKNDSVLKTWFDFKLQGYIEYVKSQIQTYNDLNGNE